LQLNRAQKAASLIKDGPALILAGPGSGKTAVITHRVKNLIEIYHIDPSDILVITFTRAAARQMQQRFTMMVPEAPPVQFGTFHSTFLHILSSSYGLTASNIIREQDRNGIIKEILSNTSAGCAGELCHAVLEEISEIKERFVSLPMDYKSKVISPEIFTQVYNEYDEALRRERLIDFDDMVGLTYKLFKERQDVRDIWRENYKYILVDEFQDINELQYKVLRQLAGVRANLFVVGDDDQSIYGFRGASPDMMRRFAAGYPKAQKLLLGINYRSSGCVVAAGANVISHNKNRFDKKLKAAKKSGELPQVLEFENVVDENAFICREIMGAVSLGYRYEEIALLFRTSATERAVSECLEKMNIPFHTDEKLSAIYEHWIARDIFAYIALARGDYSREHVVRIINKPVRYIRRELLAENDFEFRKLLTAVPDKGRELRLLLKQLRELSTMSPYAAINYIRHGIGYEGYIMQYAQRSWLDAQELVQILDELQESTIDKRSFDEWLSAIDEAREVDRRSASDADEFASGVTISTMHKAKGLEYEIVFIPDANDGLIPHRKAKLAAEIEEERRLFYVAVTRAKSRLYVLNTKLRYNKKYRRSRFVNEMLGQRVKRYGD